MVNMGEVLLWSFLWIVVMGGVGAALGYKVGADKGDHSFKWIWVGAIVSTCLSPLFAMIVFFLIQQGAGKQCLQCMSTGVHFQAKKCPKCGSSFKNDNPDSNDQIYPGGFAA